MMLLLGAMAHLSTANFRILYVEFQDPKEEKSINWANEFCFPQIPRFSFRIISEVQFGPRKEQSMRKISARLIGTIKVFRRVLNHAKFVGTLLRVGEPLYFDCSPVVRYPVWWEIHVK